MPLFGKMRPGLHFWSLVTSGSSNLFSMGRLGCLPFKLGFFQRKCCSPTRRHLSTFQVVVVHMAWSCRTFVQLFGLLKQDMDRCIKEIQSIPSREYALKICFLLLVISLVHVRLSAPQHYKNLYIYTKAQTGLPAATHPPTPRTRSQERVVV